MQAADEEENDDDALELDSPPLAALSISGHTRFRHVSQ
jgi:hypothetical protein